MTLAAPGGTCVRPARQRDLILLFTSSAALMFAFSRSHTIGYRPQIPQTHPSVRLLPNQSP